MTIDAKALRSAFSSYMTGVTVVTAVGSDDTLVGFTANSFTSVSLEPPLLLVCPGRHLSSFSVFEHCEHFAVNVLSESQEAVSNEFARSTGDRFAATDWSPDANGCPLIEGSSATFSCRVYSRQIMGDHLVLIGEVLDVKHSALQGLGYCNSGYFTLAKEREANAVASAGLTGCAGIIIEHEGQILLAKENNVMRVPHIEIGEGHGARSALVEYTRSLGLDVLIGPVYSVYDDTANGRRYTFFTASTSSSNTAGLGTYLPLTATTTETFCNNAQAEMVKRYYSEYQTREFGLYIGDADTGEIHHDE